jgi:hypothetical protein
MLRRILWPLLLAPSVAAAAVVPLEPGRWELDAKEARFVDHLGRRALYLQGGSALVAGSRFTDGIIEFDVAVSGERGFIGAFFRRTAPGELEEFYIRPHQSGNPDANQYQPLFHGVPAWQLYHGEGYGAPVVYERDAWMPVKIVVSGSRADIYVRDLTTPAVVVAELKRPVAAGGVGLMVASFAAGHFSNFRFEARERPPLAGTPKPPPPAPPGAVAAWQVSEPFAEASLDGQTALPGGARRWTRLPAEPTGLANLARVAALAEGKDTVLARVTVRSQRAQVARLRFGFSDRVRVYLDGKLLYRGTDEYRSRDYRFLGTIGWFDELYLPLRKGTHEISFAVTEEIGGWGLMAAFPELDGLRIVDE